MQLNGAVLVVAGAGTGKTRTIAYRTAFLLERGVAPENILAITFTNKAARSMKSRVAALVGEETAKLLTMCTIHSLCARMLREDIDRIGRKKDFTIFDSSDQLSLVRAALTTLGLDPAKNDPRSLHFAIGQIKNEAASQGMLDRDPRLREVYRIYDELLIKNNAIDFDDILLLADRLLEKSAETLEKYRAKFHYIMVDEYQDVNGVQYGIMKKLAGGKGNFYAVGDEDQSIYGWRGARITHIQNFENDFPGARIVKLERNYRSTQQILDAANSVISKNAGRRDKRLVTHHGPGFPVIISPAATDREEAETVIEQIISEKHKTYLKYNDFAILFRTNMQSRLYEECLIRRNISYVLVGGTKFYERKEIKDILSYMRIAANPEDAAAFERVVNYPARGIGGKSLDIIYEVAAQMQVPPMEALADEALRKKLPDKARLGVESFVLAIDRFRARAEKGQISDGLRDLIEDIDMKNVLRKAHETITEAQARYGNIEELVSSVADYESTNPKPSLVQYLENASLMTEEKEDGEDMREDCVAMMTMHSCKGLEFPVVFVVGVEEGMLPHERSKASPEDVEEERRLFYVGMTRAMKKLFISWCLTRRKFGDSVQCKPSRFLAEIDPATTQQDDPAQVREDNKSVYKDIALENIERMKKMLE